MPKRKGRLTKVNTDEDDVIKVSLKDRLENLDDKTRRKIDYLIRDFKCQRQHRLEEIEESKQSYLERIHAYYTKIPKIVPRRYLEMKFGDFEVENACLIIDYKKFLDKAKWANLNSKKTNVLKYGGTPAKFKVTYSATKRKSLARNEIRQFEFKILSSNGSKTIIRSSKKSTGAKRRPSNQTPVDSLNAQTTIKDQSSLDDDGQLVRKQREYLVNRIRQNKDELRTKARLDKEMQIDNLFKKMIDSLSEQQLNSRVSETEQKNIIRHLFGCLDKD